MVHNGITLAFDNSKPKTFAALISRMVTDEVCGADWIPMEASPQPKRAYMTGVIKSVAMTTILAAVSFIYKTKIRFVAGAATPPNPPPVPSIRHIKEVPTPDPDVSAPSPISRLLLYCDTITTKRIRRLFNEASMAVHYSRDMEYESAVLDGSLFQGCRLMSAVLTTQELLESILAAFPGTITMECPVLYIPEHVEPDRADPTE